MTDEKYMNVDLNFLVENQTFFHMLLGLLRKYEL